MSPKFFYIHAVFTRLRLSFSFFLCYLFRTKKYRSIWFLKEKKTTLTNAWRMRYNHTESNQNIKQERNKFKATTSFSSAEWKWKAISSSEYFFSLRYLFLLYIKRRRWLDSMTFAKNRHWLEIIFLFYFFFVLWKFEFWFEKLIILFLANLTCFIFRIKKISLFFFLIPLVLYISFFKPLLNLLLYLFYFLVFIFHFIIHKNSNKKLTLFLFIYIWTLINIHVYIFCRK